MTMVEVGNCRESLDESFERALSRAGTSFQVLSLATT